jgi:hypothetical protein
MVEEITEEERQQKILRDVTQYADAMRYKNTAVLMEGRDLDEVGVFLWYVKMGFAVMFAVAWREGQDKLNLYYTGLEVGHPPSPQEGLNHILGYWASLVREEEISLV